MTERAEWPKLPYAEWAPTRRTLHMATQMIGKAKLALASPQPEWLHARLFLDGRGFATGPLPYGARTVSMGIDVFESVLWIAAGDGRVATVPLTSGRCVAVLWADFQAALAGLGIALDLWERPQEVRDPTPFSRNTSDCTFVAADAQRFYRVLSTVDGVFEEFRSRFFGRTGVQFWWGSFDLTVLLFSGRRAPAPHDRGYIMRYDLDAEHLNAGFWPGDDQVPQPGFYAYLVPRPAGCESVAIEPPYAGWAEAMGQWLMPYEDVRTCADPHRAVKDFLGAVYEVATSLGGWDAEAFTYELPRAAPRGR
jgi:hypothetical protein